MKKANLLIISLIMLLILCACGEKEEKIEENSRLIVDYYGREVYVPEDINSIAALGDTIRYATYLGLQDKFSSVGECEVDVGILQAYAYVNREKFESLPKSYNDAYGAMEFFAESLIETAPDVIFTTYTKDLVETMAKQTEIPVVAVGYGTLFEDSYDEALRLIANVCGVEERAEELITYIDECLEDLNKRSSVNMENKPSVIAACATFNGIHGIEGVYANYPVFEVLNANDLAHDVSEKVGGVLLDKEAILKMNPDVIFLDSLGATILKEDYKENKSFYEELSAFKNGEVYQYPNSTLHWANVEISLADAYYVGSILYENEFADIEFEAKAKEIFKVFLGTDTYFDELSAQSLGFGKVVTTDWN